MLREPSNDSKEGEANKDGPIFEDSVMSRDTTPGVHDHSFSIRQATTSALRNTN